MHALSLATLLFLGYTLAAGFRITQPDTLQTRVTRSSHETEKDDMRLADVIDSCIEEMCTDALDAHALCLWACVVTSGAVSGEDPSLQHFLNQVELLHACDTSLCLRDDGTFISGCLPSNCLQKVIDQSPDGEMLPYHDDTWCSRCDLLTGDAQRICAVKYCQTESSQTTETQRVVKKRGWESGHHLLGKVLHDKCDSSPNFASCVQALVQTYRRKRRSSNTGFIAD